jgi:putative heme-binding domain-containing protein
LQKIAADKDAGAADRVAAIEALAELRAVSADVFKPLLEAGQPIDVRVAAVAALASTDRLAAASAAVPLLAETIEQQHVGSVLGVFLSRKGGPEALAKAINTAGPAFPAKAAERCRDVLHARGRGDAALTDALNRAMGVSPDTPAYSEAYVKELAADTATKGNRERGQQLYENKLVSCAACHAIGGKGGTLGPDLTGIGRGLTPEFVVESVLWPRRAVKEGFLSLSISTKDGSEYSGYAISEDATELRLRDVATNSVQRIPKTSIAKRINAGTIMPEGLTASLSRQELCDLMAYLTRLGK